MAEICSIKLRERERRVRPLYPAVTKRLIEKNKHLNNTKLILKFNQNKRQKGSFLSELVSLSPCGIHLCHKGHDRLTLGQSVCVGVFSFLCVLRYPARVSKSWAHVLIAEVVCWSSCHVELVKDKAWPCRHDTDTSPLQQRKSKITHCSFNDAFSSFKQYKQTHLATTLLITD